MTNHDEASRAAWRRAISKQKFRPVQAGARKVIAVEASGMADYCRLLRDANPGGLSPLTTHIVLKILSPEVCVST